MRDYLVHINETKTYRVKIRAESVERAEEIAEELFQQDKINTDRPWETDYSIGPTRCLQQLRCRRCGSTVEYSEVPGYTYYCPECDDGLYTFEVNEIEQNKDQEK